MRNLILAAAIMLFALPAYAQNVTKGSVQRLTFDTLNSADFVASDDITVGDDLTVTGSIDVGGGTAISQIIIATDTDLDNGQTSEVVTVTGATAATRCFGTITNDATNDVAISSIVTATDQATVTVTGDPGASGADLVLVCFN